MLILKHSSRAIKKEIQIQKYLLHITFFQKWRLWWPHEVSLEKAEIFRFQMTRNIILLCWPKIIFWFNIFENFDYHCFKNIFDSNFLYGHWSWNTAILLQKNIKSSFHIVQFKNYNIVSWWNKTLFLANLKFIYSFSSYTQNHNFAVQNVLSYSLKLFFCWAFPFFI